MYYILEFIVLCFLGWLYGHYKYSKGANEFEDIYFELNPKGFFHPSKQGFRIKHQVKDYAVSITFSIVTESGVKEDTFEFTRKDFENIDEALDYAKCYEAVFKTINALYEIRVEKKGKVISILNIE